MTNDPSAMRHSAPQEPQDDGKVHLDKRVNIFTLAIVICQFIGLVIVGMLWKSDVDHRLTTLEATDSTRASHESRIVIMEQRFQFIEQSLKRQEELLEKLVDKVNARL